MTVRDPMRLVLCLGLVCHAPIAIAQHGFAHAPFEEYPVVIAQAAALERLGARGAATAVPEAEDEDEQGEATDLALFGASLGAASPETLAALGHTLDASVPGSEAELNGVIGAAQAALIPPETAGLAPFRAALLASLLLDEGGVAESYEEAAEDEPDLLGVGRETWRRVKLSLTRFEPAGNLEVSEGIDEMIVRLDALFSIEEIEPGSDPEEAEAAAQRLVGFLEILSDSELYPGRNLAMAADRVLDLSREGCGSLMDGNVAVGRERLAIARHYHEMTVSGALGVMSPESEATISEAFRTSGEGALEQPGATCEALLASLAVARSVLAP